MKRIIFLLSFLFAGMSFAQDTNERRDNERENRNARSERPTYYDSKESSDYTFNDQNFRFTPDENGLNIFKIENDKEVPIGKLRRTTADGFYIMTSTTDENDISFGRFDQEGNFRTFRYDRAADRVTEEDYYSITPRDLKGDNRSDRAKERSNSDKQKTNNKGNNRGNSNSNNNNRTGNN